LKMILCSKETYTRVRVGRQLYDTCRTKNGLRQGDGLSTLFFNFALQYPIRGLR